MRASKTRAQQRPRPKHVEEARRDAVALHDLQFGVRALKDEVDAVMESRHRLEDVLLLRPVQIILRRDAHQGVRVGRFGAGHGRHRPGTCGPPALPPPPTGTSMRTPTATMRSGSGNGSGRSATTSTTEKMAVVAPVPSASTSSAPIDETGGRPQRPDGVAQIDADAVERQRARGSRGRQFLPLRLAQRSEEGFETGAVELGPCRMRGLFRRCAASDELSPSIVEVLCELLDDFALARGRQPQRRKQ